MDWTLAVYLFLSGLALTSPHRPGFWPILLVARALLVMAVLRLPPFSALFLTIGRRWPGWAPGFGAWYPLLLVPLLYKELDVLNLVVWGGRFFDGIVVAWEEWLFGAQTSSSLALAAPHVFLSELMHLSYLSYYAIIYLPPLLLYVRGRGAAFEAVVFGVSLTFLSHYLFFICFPVEGPFFRGESYLMGSMRGPVQEFTLALSTAGATKGATFPSSHVGVAVAQAVLAFHFYRRFFPIMAVGAAGVAVSAVYCGYHYGVDSVAGIVLGWALASAASRAYR